MKEAKRTHLKRYTVLFVLGVLLGIGIFLLLYGREMEHLMLIKRNLELRIERQQEVIDKLNQSQRVAKKRNDVIIEGIQVVIVDPKPDPFTQTTVARLIEKDLASLKGKKVDQVVGELLHPLLHEMLYRREYVVEGRIAEVRLKTAIVSRVILLYVTVKIKVDV
ncbi:hypothetical protein ACQCN2_20020 [Brevibacillus ginsengisoli]|uniref:hypothetical protein n=1 Tax=Brevibacillus ginsengisoli TaxID=363854 RepID=UPI003CEF1D2B